MKDTIRAYNDSYRIIERRAEDYFRKYQKHFMHGDESFGSVEVYYDEIEILWSVRWQYGGNDNGRISVPMNDFCGDWEAYLDGLIADDIEEKNRIKKREAEINMNIELAKLDELKKKYETGPECDRSQADNSEPCRTMSGIHKSND